MGGQFFLWCRNYRFNSGCLSHRKSGYSGNPCQRRRYRFRRNTFDDPGHHSGQPGSGNAGPCHWQYRPADSGRQQRYPFSRNCRHRLQHSKRDRRRYRFCDFRRRRPEHLHENKQFSTPVFTRCRRRRPGHYHISFRPSDKLIFKGWYPKHLHCKMRAGNDHHPGLSIPNQRPGSKYRT